MTEIIRLAPHDPVPDYGNHALVLRHMGEDDPNAVVIEIVFYGPEGSATAAHHPDGTAMTLEEAVTAARAQAGKKGVARLYVVDRLAGKREQEVISHHGDHTFPGEKLDDTDVEDGVSGSDIRDRTTDAGYLR